MNTNDEEYTFKLEAEVDRLHDEIETLQETLRASWKPADWDFESYCVEQCGRPATHERVTGMAGDTPVVELVCCPHSHGRDVDADLVRVLGEAVMLAARMWGARDDQRIRNAAHAYQQYIGGA